MTNDTVTMTKQQMDIRSKMFSQWMVRCLVKGTIDHIDQIIDAALDLRLIDLDSNNKLVATKADEEKNQLKSN